MGQETILEEPQKAFWGPHFLSHFGLMFGYYIKYVRSTWESWVEISLAYVWSLTSSMNIVNIVILHSMVIFIWNFCCLYMWSIISFFLNQVRFIPGSNYGLTLEKSLNLLHHLNSSSISICLSLTCTHDKKKKKPFSKLRKKREL